MGRGVCGSLPSVSVPPCASLYWQSVYLQVYMEVLVGPLSCGSSFEMHWWADTEPADPDLLFEVSAPQPRKPLGLSPRLFILLLHNMYIWPLLTGIVTGWIPTLLSSACIPVCLAACCWLQASVTLWYITEWYQRLQITGAQRDEAEKSYCKNINDLSRKMQTP